MPLPAAEGSASGNVPSSATAPAQEPLTPALLCRAPGCAQRAFRRCVKCPTQLCADHMSTTRRFPDRDYQLPYRCAACVDLPTDGGVSFVVPSESARLSHVVYQAAHIKPLPSQALTDAWVEFVRGPCIVSVLNDAFDHADMSREFLLRPEKRQQLAVGGERRLGSFAEISQLFQEKRVLVAHLVYGERITAAPSVTASNLHLVFVFRRAQLWASARKEEEFVAYEEEEKEKKTGGINARLELYVDEAVWTALTPRQRGELKYFQVISDDLFGCILEALNSRATADRVISTVNTREGFKIRLTPVNTPIPLGGGRVAMKTTWYFPRDNVPHNFDVAQHGPLTDLGAPAGVVTYNDVFTQDELRAIERDADKTDEDGRKGKFDQLPNTRQETLRGKRLVRTKYFFGARYLWTADQTKDKREYSKAAGVRIDVAAPPRWLKERVESRLVGASLVPAAWLNSYAINFYHDGTEGLHQHFDDKTRFNQPVFTLRIFSDSRLVFGAVGLAMTNPWFFVPMPRGCVTVLEDMGYAANAIKHCIRPADMVGKSAAIILRQIHPAVYAEAQKLLMQSEIMQWVCAIRGIEEPVPIALAMQREAVNKEALAHLTECDLKLLGVDKVGTRRLLMNAIEEERQRRHLPARPGCSCELNATADALQSRVSDPSPLALRNLLLMFPWLSDTLASGMPPPSSAPAPTAAHTHAHTHTQTAPPPPASLFSSFVLAPPPPPAAQPPPHTPPPAHVHTCAAFSPDASPLARSASDPSPPPKRPARAATPPPATPPSAASALPTFRRNTLYTPSTPSSSSSASPASTYSSPMSVRSLAFSDSSVPNSTHSAEFWLSASPIAAPATPLYAPSEEELQKSAESARGVKRAVENPLHRTA